MSERAKYFSDWYTSFEQDERLEPYNSEGNGRVVRVVYMNNVMGSKPQTGAYGCVAQVFVKKNGLFNYEAVRSCPEPNESVRKFTKRGAVKVARQKMLEILADMNKMGLLVSKV